MRVNVNAGHPAPETIAPVIIGLLLGWCGGDRVAGHLELVPPDCGRPGTTLVVVDGMSGVDGFHAVEILIDKRIHELVAQGVKRSSSARLRHDVRGRAGERVDKAVHGNYTVRRVIGTDAERGVRGCCKINVKASDKDLILDRARNGRAVNVHDPFRLARWWRTASSEARRQITVCIAEVRSRDGEPDREPVERVALGSSRDRHVQHQAPRTRARR